MLSRPNRLRKTNDFKRIFKNGKTAQADNLFVKVRPNKERIVRIGIIVSKKVTKKAVERNKIRRVLSEALRPHISSIKQEYDIILVVRPGFSLLKVKDAEKTIHTLLKRLALFV